MRHEDLQHDAKKALTEIFQFLLSKEDLSGSNIMRRIEKVAQNLQQAKQDSNTEQKSFSQEHLDEIKTQMSEMLYYFAYTNTASDSEGMEDLSSFKTEFFKFEKHQQMHLDHYA